MSHFSYSLPFDIRYGVTPDFLTKVFNGRQELAEVAPRHVWGSELPPLSTSVQTVVLRHRRRSYLRCFRKRATI